MKKFSKETPARQSVISKAIYCRDIEGLYMNSAKAAARYSNTKAANVQKLHFYFSTIVNQVKTEFLRISVWLSVLGGE